MTHSGEEPEGASIALQISATCNNSEVDTDQEARRESGGILIPHLVVETRTHSRSRYKSVLNHVPTVSISDVSGTMSDASGPLAAERIHAQEIAGTRSDQNGSTHPSEEPGWMHAWETTGTMSDQSSPTHTDGERSPTRLTHPAANTSASTGGENAGSRNAMQRYAVRETHIPLSTAHS